LYQTSLFDVWSNATSELVYRFDPGRLEPFGKPRMPGTSDGLPVPQ
jgi:hypothetical protein